MQRFVSVGHIARAEPVFHVGPRFSHFEQSAQVGVQVGAEADLARRGRDRYVFARCVHKPSGSVRPRK
jgi:hypothetical protein